MTHFHVMLAQHGGLPHADIRVEEYTESIDMFVRLGNELYKDLREDSYDLTIEQTKDATNNGESHAAFVGPTGLRLYWLRCEADHQSYVSPSWN